ncbi:hypothetical protein [Acidithrix sp. C25]|uniref:hypothetical protein n=1 Tax=Acidithrix sp. C25 TaxID=1671482 RepID=UPI00191BC75D|nr:hypothetical protein [Acidithrix sp. C25]
MPELVSLAKQKELFMEINGYLLDFSRSDIVLNVDSDETIFRHYLRCRGQEREVITIWITQRGRTVMFETYFMPYPEENVAQCFEYLLASNSRIHPMSFSIGIEDAIFITGTCPTSNFTRNQLEEYAGAQLQYSDEIFPIAMSIGYESKYRRSRAF